MAAGWVRSLAGQRPSQPRMVLSCIAACIAALELGAVLVPVQAALSGVLQVPLVAFLLPMLGVHLVIGAIEGVITAIVLAYEFFALYEHTARATAGVIYAPLKRFNHFYQQSNYTSWCIELSTFLTFGTGKLAEEVLIDPAENILGTTLLIT